MAVLQEMEPPDNGTAAIVAAAFIENNLALAIMVKFRELDKKDQSDIFENRGVFV